MWRKLLRGSVSVCGKCWSHHHLKVLLAGFPSHLLPPSLLLHHQSELLLGGERPGARWVKPTGLLHMVPLREREGRRRGLWGWGMSQDGIRGSW